MEAAQPLLKELFDKLVAAGVQTVTLNFSGGSDEGFLNVSLRGKEMTPGEVLDKLESDVEDWAEDAYQYSGTGGGEGDYGDDIEYDLVKRKVTTSDWYMARTDGDVESASLVID